MLLHPDGQITETRAQEASGQLPVRTGDWLWSEKTGEHEIPTNFVSENVLNLKDALFDKVGS